MGKVDLTQRCLSLGNLKEHNLRSVLVVDDSRMQRRLLCRALRKWGFDVHEAENGEAALQLCRELDISMIISDWMMPGMNGPDFCRAFRKLDRGAYGYFVLLTSKNTSDEIAEGLNSGADDFLTKPVSLGELQARLRAGERVLQMQEQLVEKNSQIKSALEEVRAMYAQLDRDLEEARSLQLSLVPESDIQIPEGRISMLLRPCGHVGGDLVGKFQVSDTELGLFSLDVSGHGISSALMTARLAGCLNGMSPNQNVAMRERGDGSFEARDPADTALELNSLLLSELETEHYFTLALAIVDLRSGNVECVQAGHPHPVLFDSSGAVSVIGDGGMPVGLVPDAEFQSFSFSMQPGQSLMLFSDGITETADTDGNLLDEKGLSDWIEKSAHLDAPDMLGALMTHLQAFGNQAEFADDISAIVFRWDGPDTPDELQLSGRPDSLVA